MVTRKFTPCHCKIFCPGCMVGQTKVENEPSGKFALFEQLQASSSLFNVSFRYVCF